MIKQHGPVTLFLSYTHKDEPLRQELEGHLSGLKREGLISIWHDRQIMPGTDWAHEIDAHLNEASVILLLVSPSFINSDYCYDIEMQRALERHKHGDARVVPIILRPCDWQHSPLKDLQCLPCNGKPVTEWDNPDTAFLDITKGLRKVIEHLARPLVPLSPLNQEHRRRMIGRVRAIWIDGLLKKSLHQDTRIELCLQDRPDVLEIPLRLQVQELNQPPQTLPDGTTVMQVYDKAEGELLLLGKPGAGKTTLLLELLCTLLERAEKDEHLRIPILFHLSSWAEKRQPLRAWLVEELRTKYQVSPKTGQSWIDADQVMPLLDGLDEVAKDARSACVEQINDYYQSRLERGSSPIVVCCRSEEYMALSTRVMLQHAVSILPLTDEQINTYLEQAGEQVEALKQALGKDEELLDLVRQPLMLNCFTLAYQGAQAPEVQTGATPEETQRIIFSRYIEHMLDRRSVTKPYTKKQMKLWLSWLAKQLIERDQTVFYVEQMQPNWLPHTHLYRGLTFGILFGMVYGLFGLLTDFSLGHAVIFALSGSMLGVIFGYGEEDHWLARRELMAILIGLLASVFYGIIGYQVDLNPLPTHVSPLSTVILRVIAGFVNGSWNGLLFGYIYWILADLETAIHPVEKVSWNWKSMWQYLPRSFRIGLAYAGILVLLALWAGVIEGGMTLGLKAALLAVLFKGTSVVFYFSVLNGWVKGLSGAMLEEQERKNALTRPNQGIRLSLRYGMRVWLISGLTFLFIELLAGFFTIIVLSIVGIEYHTTVNGPTVNGHPVANPLALILATFTFLTLGTIYGIYFGFIGGLRYGGMACLQHIILRFLLWRRGMVPWKYPRFLDDAANRLLLRKIGGSYIFVHRLLLDYFASLEFSSTKDNRSIK